jgi:hypothetical protein
MSRRGSRHDPGPGRPARAWLLSGQLGDVEACDEPDGWPEFAVTLRFYVSSDDPDVIERLVRQRTPRSARSSQLDAAPGEGDKP